MSTDTLHSQITEAMTRYWGYDSFRPLQEQAMRCVMEDRDSLVVLPTGGGKSLCFQVPAVCGDGMAVVVSPLISLMKDQVDALNGCGVPAAFVNSTLSHSERADVANRVRAGEIRLLYMAPERLVIDRTLDFLREANVRFFAIDEAHCISEWGHDFRPEYRQLKVLKEAFPAVAVHCYTATATDRVRQDIVRNLGLSEMETLVGSFDRPNLSYKVEMRNDVVQQVRQAIERHKDESGIVYCIRRKDVDHMATMLNQYGFRALPYHAGLSAVERQRNQDAFITDKTDIIVATVAFGMGIDKPNVRFVLHAGMPKSLENYQQESGRAGRDGLEAECSLFYSGGDFHTWKFMLSDLQGDAYTGAVESLSKMYDYCTSVSCRHRALVEYFDEEYPSPTCSACDVCLGDFETVPEPMVLGQKILSCVVRLSEQFGGDYTSLVLCGSKDKRILERGHDEIKTWGLLQDEDRRNVRDWIEQLVGQRFLLKEGAYNQLKVTEEGWKILRGETSPRLLKSKAAKKSKRGGKGKSKAAAESWEGVDKGLFDALRTLRTEIAKERGVPSYIVFGDTTLRDLARRRPTSPEELLKARGVGEKKQDEFGETFLTVIIAHCKENDLATDITPDESAEEPPAVEKPAPIERTPSRSAFQAFPLFDEGKSVAEVAEAMSRAESTVHGYLSSYLTHNKITDASRWVSAEVIARVEAAADELRTTSLREMFEALEEAVDYNSIRIVLSCRRRREEGA